MLKEFSREETNSFLDGAWIQVEEGMFNPGGTYIYQEAYEVAATSSDAVVYDTYEYEFTYLDLIQKSPIFREYEIVICEGESVDLNEHLVFTPGYDGEYFFTVYNDDYYDTFYSDTFLPREYAEIDDNGVLTGIDEGAVYVDINDSYYGYADECHIIIEEKEAETFEELLVNSAEKLGKGWLEAFMMIGSYFVLILELLLLPITAWL